MSYKGKIQIQVSSSNYLLQFFPFDMEKIVGQRPV